LQQASPTAPTYTQLLNRVVAAVTDKLCADALAKGGNPNRDTVTAAVRSRALDDWRTRMPAHFWAGYCRENPTPEGK